MICYSSIWIETFCICNQLKYRYKAVHSLYSTFYFILNSRRVHFATKYVLCCSYNFPNDSCDNISRTFTAFTKLSLWLQFTNCDFKCKIIRLAVKLYCNYNLIYTLCIHSTFPRALKLTKVTKPSKLTNIPWTNSMSKKRTIADERKKNGNIEKVDNWIFWFDIFKCVELSCVNMTTNERKTLTWIAIRIHISYSLPQL